ncbi:MAG: 30S ribosomal protein S4, partial [Candidatus Jordarchaeaceae archaeon]
EKARRILVGKLNRLGILSLDATLDDVMKLTVEDILGRRLQTLVHKQGLSNSIYHARQLITHGHIVVAGRRITSPGLLVKRDDENLITFSPSSPLNDPNHPARIKAKTQAE